MKRIYVLFSMAIFLLALFGGIFSVKAEEQGPQGSITARFDSTMYGYSGLSFQARVSFTNSTDTIQNLNITVTVPETSFIPLSLGTFRGPVGRVEKNMISWNIALSPRMTGEINLTGLVSVLTETHVVSDFFAVHITGYDLFTRSMELRPNPSYIILVDLAPRGCCQRRKSVLGRSNSKFGWGCV